MWKCGRCDLWATGTIGYQQEWKSEVLSKKFGKWSTSRQWTLASLRLEKGKNNWLAKNFPILAEVPVLIARNVSRKGWESWIHQNEQLFRGWLWVTTMCGWLWVSTSLLFLIWLMRFIRAFRLDSLLLHFYWSWGRWYTKSRYFKSWAHKDVSVGINVDQPVHYML